MRQQEVPYTLDVESLVKPLPPQKANERRAWSIPLNTVWVPVFTALRVNGKLGESDMADETLGAPLRLAVDKDGTPRFNSKGLPMTKVAKQLNDQVKVVRENFVAHLMGYAATTKAAKTVEYKALVERAQQAGEAVLAADAQAVERFLAAKKAVQDALEAAHAQPQGDHTQPTPELVAA